MMEVPPGVVCENDGIVIVASPPPLLNFLFLFRRLSMLLRELRLRLLRNLRENFLLLNEADFDLLPFFPLLLPLFLLFFEPPLFDTFTRLCWCIFRSIPLLTAVWAGLASVIV